MKKKKVSFSIILLVTLEQLIKLIINSKLLGSNIEIVPSLLYFKPMFNRDYSWINSLFDLGIGRIFHLFLVLFILGLIYLTYKHIIAIVSSNKYLDLSYIFIMSGALCSFIDKLFWDGSLDYIYLKGFFTFDLKDIYISLYIALTLYLLFFKAEELEKIEAEYLLKKKTD